MISASVSTSVSSTSVSVSTGTDISSIIRSGHSLQIIQSQSNHLIRDGRPR